MRLSSRKFEADLSQGNNLHLKSQPPRGSSNLKSICRAESHVFIPGVTFPQSSSLPRCTFTVSAAKQAPLSLNISVPVGDAEPRSRMACCPELLLSNTGTEAACPCLLNPYELRWGTRILHPYHQPLRRTAISLPGSPCAQPLLLHKQSLMMSSPWADTCLIRNLLHSAAPPVQSPTPPPPPRASSLPA